MKKMTAVQTFWSLCDRAYNDNKVTSLHCGATLLGTIQIDHDVMMYWEDLDGDLIMIFRGSDDWKDWFSNILQCGIFSDYHEDMYNISSKFVNKLLFEAGGIITKYLERGNKIGFGGHSRGALLAVYTSKMIYDVYGVSMSCITFGCPNQYSSELRNKYNLTMIDCTHVINPGDIVCDVPVSLKKAGKVYMLKHKGFWGFRFRIIGFKSLAHLRERYSVNLGLVG